MSTDLLVCTYVLVCVCVGEQERESEHVVLQQCFSLSLSPSFFFSCSLVLSLSRSVHAHGNTPVALIDLQVWGLWLLKCPPTQLILLVVSQEEAFEREATLWTWLIHTCDMTLERCVTWFVICWGPAGEGSWKKIHMWYDTFTWEMTQRKVRF